MQTWVVIASGQSLNHSDVEYVRLAKVSGAIHGVIAISNVGLDFAPWADYLVSSDQAWWIANPTAVLFQGRKFCRHQLRDTEQYICNVNGANSGLMGMFIALDIAKADKIILLGFDMKGTHYFGAHPSGLKNTTEKRFKEHIEQFRRFPKMDVVNCTPDSALEIFPKAELRAII